jgi:hypothetical protein
MNLESSKQGLESRALLGAGADVGPLSYFQALLYSLLHLIGCNRQQKLLEAGDLTFEGKKLESSRPGNVKREYNAPCCCHVFILTALSPPALPSWWLLSSEGPSWHGLPLAEIFPSLGLHVGHMTSLLFGGLVSVQKCNEGSYHLLSSYCILALSHTVMSINNTLCRRGHLRKVKSLPQDNRG